MAEQGPSLNDILSQYALTVTDLSMKCPREIRNEIAVKLSDWKMIGHFLDFPTEKLTSIGRENETQDLCKVALLDAWSKREGEGASCLKLAVALHRRQRRDLVEFLCKRIACRGGTAEMGSRQQTTSSSAVREAVTDRSRTTTCTSLLQETFKCPCGKCSLMVYLRNGCPKSCIPYLGMPANLSIGDERNLKYTLNKDTRKLCNSFRDLSDSTCDSLIKQGINLDRLIRVATNHDRSLQLASVQSMDEAFTVLAKSMSFFNHKLLANIIDKLGDEGDKQRLVKYSEEFNHYCKRKIFEVDPGNWVGGERFSEVCTDGRQLFAMVVSDFMIQTLGDTELVIETLADVLDIQPASLHIHRIDRGSVILVFSVPNCIANEIFPLPQEKMSLLKAKGITIFVPNIFSPQNYESNRAPLLQPRCGGTSVGPFSSNLDSGCLSYTSMEAMSSSTSPGPSSHGGGANRVKQTEQETHLFRMRAITDKNAHLTQSGFSTSSTSTAEQNDFHDMSAEELKLECQRLRDENHQLQLKVCGVNELTKLLQDRSELIQVLEEKNKRLEIAIVRLENRCANYDRMLKLQKGANVSTAKPDRAPFIPGTSRQVLEGLMKENSDLKKIINNLSGKPQQANEALQLQVTQLKAQLAQEVNEQNTELRSQNRDHVVQAAEGASEALKLQMTQLRAQLAEVNRQNTVLRSRNRDLLWQLQQIQPASGSEGSS